MSRQASPGIARVLAVLLAVALLWLAQQAGREGIAGIYGFAAARQQLELRNRPQSAGDRLAEAERLAVLARGFAPGRVDYALQSADIAAADQRHEAALLLLRQALVVAPVRADLWSRLASYSYAHGGLTAITLQALDNALRYGPYEYDARLVNATITLGAGSELDVGRRVRGWNDLVEAASIPALSRQIYALAGAAGMERQLQVQVAENRREREAREQRAMQRGDVR